jgi:hypothetical protein
MQHFIQRLLHWLDALARAFFSIFNEEEDTGANKTVVEPGVAAAGTPLLQPGELAMGSDEAPVYALNKSLLTYQEQRLYRAIRSTLKGEYLIMTKVRMGDFVWLKNEPKDRKYANNQVLCKHVDFLLCSRDSLKPLLVIELDDSSHVKSLGAIERDNFKNATFAAIGMPLLRVPLQEKYDYDGLGVEIRSRLGEV